MIGELEHMNLKKYLENRIRGWFPKELKLPSSKVRMNSEEKKVSKSWRRFWSLLVITYVVLIIIQVILYLLAYINLSTLFGGALVLLLIIPLSYAIWHIQTRYQHSRTVHLMNKLAFILGGALLAFPTALFATALIIWALGLPPLVNYMGQWLTIILFFFVSPIVGAFIGYRIGKRRNHRPYM